ncbi:hypothetical protein K461DRAFT_315415 [Myriangium duriaei CBS 260.36]|uniref:Protein kinase domain-containing protein n=1 Tax=Myriangium duriaei CBS 260.36 TaxID=1168546 RepID=A0A9P4IVS1_9PEZI|nr:hypothetical protein K461DRAFT_315415 [Myriangium duriaei CBS 260.36]
MISPDDRFWVRSGSEFRPIVETTLFVIPVADWDERRFLVIYGEAPCEELDTENEDEYSNKIFSALREHAASMADDTWKLHLDRDWKVDTEQGALENHYEPVQTFYPRLEDCPELAHFAVISRNHMVEVDRLHSQIDNCYYKTSDFAKKFVVFKYFLISEQSEMVWNELQIWSSIPPHPFIARFDRIVVEESDDSRVVGFTINYISGSNLKDNPRSLVKFKWLQQLIQVVDDLNLKYGIWHRDIHPRNILIDSDRNDSIQLIDFNFALRFGQLFHGQPRHEDFTRADTIGVVFTLYELITRDYHHRSDVWDYPNVRIIMDLPEWKVHPEVVLDHDIGMFRHELSTWLSKRQSRGFIQHYDECPEHIGSSKDIPRPPTYSVPIYNMAGEVTENMEAEPRTAAEFHRLGLPVVEWKRPAQDKLEKSKLYLANGKALEGVAKANLEW